MKPIFCPLCHIKSIDIISGNIVSVVEISPCGCVFKDKINFTTPYEKYDREDILCRDNYNCCPIFSEWFWKNQK
jgi:hypothetical protein